MRPYRNRALRIKPCAKTSRNRQSREYAWAQTQLRLNADSPWQEDPGYIALLRTCGCFNHDASVCAFREAQKTGHHERSGKTYREWLGEDEGRA